MIDSSDRERIDEAHEELMKMLSRDEMKAPCLGCLEPSNRTRCSW